MVFWAENFPTGENLTEKLPPAATTQLQKSQLALWYKVGNRTYDQEVVGSTNGRVAIKWSLYLDV